MRVRALRLGLFLAIAVAPAAAHAQLGVDAQLFHPALDSYGICTVDRSEVSHPWDFGFKLALDLAGNPLRLDMTDPTDPTHVATQRNVLMGSRMTVDLGAHVGLTRWLELVLAVPFSAQSYTAAFGTQGTYADGGAGVTSVPRTGFYAAERLTNIPPPNVAANDMRVGFKARLAQAGMFGIGAAAVLTVPIGDSSAFLGDSSLTVQPKVIADLTRGPITAAINVGAVLRKETVIYDPYDLSSIASHTYAGPARVLVDVGSELTYSLGFAYHFVRWMGFGAELTGLVPLVGVKKDFTGDVLAGLQIFPKHNLALAVGAGTNVFASAARRDDYRAFLGLSWTPGDGARSAVGGLDSDNDGIPDAVDQCPNEPEDRDGFEDDDGCPDPDNDRDGIPDSIDRCPNEPEDRDGFEDDDGCPELDNDHDGIPDTQDKCPNEPEDRDGFEDDDGCPDLDNDGDGIADAIDRCPNEPETRNGVDDDDGCPDSGGAVVVTAGKIEVPEQIQFESGSAKILGRSEALVGHIVEKIKANPQVRRIRIEGHTDDVGSAKRNLEVSQGRADAVRMALIARGVEPDRLQAVGYGNTRPLDRRRTTDARAKNRRVDFIIVEE
jgi:large repetitive protein